jgi:hypothetical protein
MGEKTIERIPQSEPLQIERVTPQVEYAAARLRQREQPGQPGQPVCFAQRDAQRRHPPAPIALR